MLNPDALKQQIYNLLLQHPELADDEVLRADTLEGATDLHEALSMLVDRERETDALTVGMTARIKTLQDRRARHEARIVAIRSIIFKLMQAADLSKVTLPEATLSFRNVAPKVLITDEDSLPVAFKRFVMSPNKEEIGEALKAGKEVPGATMSNGDVTISVRVR